METKRIRIRLRTWNKLRRDIRGRKNETLAAYMDRVIERIEGGEKWKQKLKK